MLRRRPCSFVRVATGSCHRVGSATNTFTFVVRPKEFFCASTTKHKYAAKIFIDPTKTVDLGHHTIEVRMDKPEHWVVPKDWSEFQFPPKIIQLAAQINSLNAIENLMLVRYIGLKRGLSEDQLFGGGGQVVVQAQAAAPAPPPEEPKKPEKVSFKLVLTAVDTEAKVKVLKEVRVIKPGMKLLESKELVDKLPSILKEDVTKEEGETWVKKFKEAGGVAELQ